MAFNSKTLLSSSLGLILLAYVFNKKEYTEIVETSQGKLQGIVSKSRHGKAFSEFWGIPYAQPPVGDLRYQSPVPVGNWSDVRIADQYGIECLQMEFMLASRVVGQEDCLYLNVFTPYNFNMRGELYPVIVYIHGGGFMTGSSKVFKADYLIDEDVVLVTVNYRLGVLGFLNTGDEVVRGNMGMKDQNLALKWIQENIKYFGGSPNKVTLMGESAGAASVHLHSLSDQSRGLFQKAISLSGTAVSPWAFQRDPVGQFQQLGKQFNCDTVSSSVFLQCLQKLDPSEVVKVYLANRDALVDPLEFYGPTIEKIIDEDTFLSESPFERYRSKNFTPVPWMIGVNEGEGLVFAIRLFLDNVANKKMQKISGWYEGLPRLLLLENLSEENAKKITKFYFNVEDRDFNPLDQFENLTNLFSDRLFFNPLDRIIEFYQNQNPNGSATEMKTALQESLYLYYYTYNGFFSLLKLISSAPAEKILPFEVLAAYQYLKGFVIEPYYGGQEKKLPACHADEVALIFNIGYVFSINTWSKEYAFSVQLTKTIANFAKTTGTVIEFNGKPWSPIAPNEVNFMRLDGPGPEAAGLIQSPFAERLSFWKSLNLNEEV